MTRLDGASLLQGRAGTDPSQPCGSAVHRLHMPSVPPWVSLQSGSLIVLRKRYDVQASAGGSFVRAGVRLGARTQGVFSYPWLRARARAVGGSQWMGEGGRPSASHNPIAVQCSAVQCGTRNPMILVCSRTPEIQVVSVAHDTSTRRAEEEGPRSKEVKSPSLASGWTRAPHRMYDIRKFNIPERARTRRT